MRHCPQISAIGAYHDGELSAARRADVEAHLAGCVECSAELEELRQLSTLIAAEPAVSMSRDFSEGLHEQVDEWTDSSVLRFAQLVCGIAAAVMIGVGGWLMAMPDAPSEPLPVWEQAAVTLNPASPVSNGSIRTAEWMVTELASR